MSFVGLVLPSTPDTAHSAAQHPVKGSLHQTTPHALGCPRLSAGLVRRQLLRRSAANDALCSAGRHTQCKAAKNTKRSTVRTCAVASETRQVTTGESASPSSEAASSSTGPTEAATATSDAPSISSPAEQVPPQQTGTAQPGNTPHQDKRPHPNRPQQQSSRSSYQGGRNFQPGGPRSSQRQNFGTRLQGPPLVPVPDEEKAWLQPRMTVVAKVVYSNLNGFKIAMLKDERIGGYG